MGSIRRRKATVSDIELLFVPRMSEVPDDLFNTAKVNLAEQIIERWLQNGLLAKRPNSNGHFSWGPQNKLAVHVPSGIPVDLFATTERKWYVSLVIRTGSRETNLRLTNGAIRMGGTLHAYGSGFSWKDGTNTDAACEEDVFRLAGVPYLEPHRR